MATRCIALFAVLVAASSAQMLGQFPANYPMFAPWMNPGFNLPMFPGQFPMLASFPQQQQHHHHGGSRPSAPDVSTNSNDQDSLQQSLQTWAGNSASTLMGSLSSTGAQVMGGAHTFFKPPYSWMWRVGLSGAALKYDNVDRVADIPELMSLITGYFAGDPIAMEAARRAEDNNDRFSLTSLSHLFQSEPGISKAPVVAPGQHPAPAPAPQGLWGQMFGSSTPAAPAAPAHAQAPQMPQSASNPQAKRDFWAADDADDDNLEDVDMEAPKPQPQPSSWMSGLFGSDDQQAKQPVHKPLFPQAPPPPANKGGNSLFGGLFNNPAGTAAKQPFGSSTPSSAGLMSMLGALGGSKGSSGSAAQQMIKMAAPMLGVDPSLANMAAPLLSSLV